MYAQVEDITGLEVPHELHVKRSHSTRNETYAVVNQADVVINGALGTGAWGTVSAGVYCECSVAIKQPHRWIMHETLVDRMKCEASIMASTHHPNLITFIAWSQFRPWQIAYDCHGTYGSKPLGYL